MDENRLVVEFQELTSSYFSRRIEYTSVHALLIYWHENDLEFGDKLIVLRKTLENDYHYIVKSFPIPSTGGQQRLNLELSSFVVEWSNKPDTLIIVYYSGHCFSGEQNEARWSAYENDGPDLSWSACQQTLFGAIGDVLLVLDCCGAANISSGFKQSGRFEIVAASGKGVATPGPGKVSFTSFFVRELRSRKDKGVTARQLVAVLSRKNLVQQTPVLLDMVDGNHPSILIEPLNQPRHAGCHQKPSSSALLRLSLTDDLTGVEIANWLKLGAPASVIAVAIEAVAMKAREIQDWSHAFPSHSIFNKLPENIRRDILKQMRGLNSVAEESTASTLNMGTSVDIRETAMTDNSVQETVLAVTTAVETPMLLDLTETELESVPNVKCVSATGVDEVVTLRQALLQEHAIPESLQIPKQRIESFSHHEQERFGSCQIRGQRLLIEFFPYSDDGTAEGEPLQSELNRTNEITGLLCQSKRASFHILPCIGYTVDTVDRQFGLIFEPPFSRETPMHPLLLQDVYAMEPYTTLSDRARIAHALVVAIESLHRIGWVHKELRSDNLAFLPSHDPSKPHDDRVKDRIDLSSLWLFGFGYARAEAAETFLTDDYNIHNNLYRHPDRWGRPNIKFTRSHDMYSLGIVLFEIANWRRIDSLVDVKRNHVTSSVVFNEVEQRCKKKLPFQVGQVFTSVIMACLHFERSTQGLNEYGMQRHFQEVILKPLKQMVGRI